MLKEISSSAFRDNGIERPPIRFNLGLNAVLGKDDAENSIGKSSFLLAIDFAFGGRAYPTCDGVQHIGDHTICFAFQFNNKTYYFSRDTAKPEIINCCNSKYTSNGDTMDISSFGEWLKKMYSMDNLGASFRSVSSCFFRVADKDNLDINNPLKSYSAQSKKESIDLLLRLFDKHQGLDVYRKDLDDIKGKHDAYKKAQEYNLMANLKGGKKTYNDNLEKIRNLTAELNSLKLEHSELRSEEEIEKSRQKADLTDKRMRVEAELERARRRKTLVTMSIEYGLYPTEADLMQLQEFFPSVNIRKIYEVEQYHKKLAAILNKQFDVEAAELDSQIDNYEKELKNAIDEIDKIGFVGDVSKALLQKHHCISKQIEELEQWNKHFTIFNDLKEEKKKADERLKIAIREVLNEVERAINTTMEALNDSLYDESRKSPKFMLLDYNNYSFDTPDDTGTGSKYKGLILFDLSILQLSRLPAIIHDSLVFKNISDKVVDGIMDLYAQYNKQIFVSFDKLSSYPPNTREILNDHKVLQLSNGGSELYGETWNRKV